VIHERLGNASIKTTMDTYGHFFDGLDEAGAERLDAFCACLASTQCALRVDAK
jgi:hypothetical protein